MRLYGHCSGASPASCKALPSARRAECAVGEAEARAQLATSTRGLVVEAER